MKNWLYWNVLLTVLRWFGLTTMREFNNQVWLSQRVTQGYEGMIKDMKRDVRMTKAQLYARKEQVHKLLELNCHLRQLTHTINN